MKENIFTFLASQCSTSLSLSDPLAVNLQ